MAARAPSFKFKTEPATLGGEGSDGDGSKEVDRLKQELEMAEYGRQSAKRHVEDLRSEIKELMREVSKLKEDNTTLQQQREEAIQRERQLKQQLEEEQQEQQDRVSNKTGSHAAATSELAPVPDSSDYQKMDSQLYYHTSSGCYYEALLQQYLVPYQEQSSEQAQTTTTSTHVSTTASTTVTTVTSSSSSTTCTTSQPVMGGDIASTLAAVSERATQQYGFTYDSNTGYYYDAKTNLYYDQTSQLYYDAENGTYYYYDADKKQYEIHSRVEMPDASSEQPKEQEKEEEEVVMNLEERVVEVSAAMMELLNDASDSPEDGEISISRSIRDIPDAPPPEGSWPPCLRVVVKKSTVLEVGTVIVITAHDGAEIGREALGPNTIKLQDIQTSKQHCSISYMPLKESFTITDLGSVNGTFLNKCRLSKSKEKSKPYMLQHSDSLVVGGTTMLVHIHNGMDVCPSCCPSAKGTIILPEPSSNEPLEIQRRKELNKIKKRYGLRVKDTIGEDPGQLPEQYSDKAATRRRLVGSDNPHTDNLSTAQPSSVHRAISEENLGHRLLERMGWKEGEGLGRTCDGMQNPITAVIHDERSGLGFGHSVRDMQTSGAAAGGSGENWRKMRKRYQETIEQETKRKHSKQDTTTGHQR